MNAEIIIVSGLPRSGTSLMMQMLARGGVEVVTDHCRRADIDNPHGYFELEDAKRIGQDASWLPGTRGKAFKMVSQLLYDLPPSEHYRILFMERDLDETLLSQEKMLRRLGRRVAPKEAMKQSYQVHLEHLHRWLRYQPYMMVLCIRYNDLVTAPRPEAERVAAFLDGRADIDGMISAVDASLYRNRKDSGIFAHPAVREDYESLD
jgi:hypothetical protein